MNSCGTATAVAQQRPNLVSLSLVFSHCSSISYCHIRGVCILPGCQIPDGCKRSQFNQNYVQSARLGSPGMWGDEDSGPKGKDRAGRAAAGRAGSFSPEGERSYRFRRAYGPPLREQRFTSFRRRTNRPDRRRPGPRRTTRVGRPRAGTVRTERGADRATRTRWAETDEGRP